MVLAELHGKRFPEIEGQEDWLTSAVFGHLRQVHPKVFWEELFGRAMTVEEPAVSLASRLHGLGISLSHYAELKVLFWRNCAGYGEPDLLLRFSGEDVPPLIVLLEVKLNSSKSGVGKDDQLARYLRLLDDASALPEWRGSDDCRVILYLTRAFAGQELRESIEASANPENAMRLFGLEWRDVLEIADSLRFESELLAEVADFLKRRGFEAFKGFRGLPSSFRAPSGSFYGSVYFSKPCGVASNLCGRFYGR